MFLLSGQILERFASRLVLMKLMSGRFYIGLAIIFFLLMIFLSISEPLTIFPSKPAPAESPEHITYYPTVDEPKSGSYPTRTPADASALWWHHTSMDTNGNFIHDDLEGGDDPLELFPVYVDLVRPADRPMIDRVANVGGEISYVCKYIDTICMRNVTLPMMERLLAMDDVVFIEKQPYLTVNLDVSARSVAARPSEEYSPKTGWEFGYTGKDIVVAVLDTGVDDNHDDLKGKFVAGYDCSGNYGVAWATNPDDKNGHGTHCAGVVMGTGDPDDEPADREHVGIAPDAKLVDVKVLTDIGGNLGDHLIMGMEWCIENREQFGIKVLSISVGNKAGGDDGTNANARTADAAVDAGLVVVAAAGNEGPYNDGFSSVAASDKAITVGAVDDGATVSRDDDVIAEYSNRGPRRSDNDEDVLEELKPDVVAPGTDIMACMYSPRPVGFVTGYQQMTGTSMACPHVAGIAALMLEAKQGINASQIKQILRMTADGMGTAYDTSIDEKYSKDYGFGEVDVYEALRESLEDYQTVSIDSVKNNDIIGGVYEIEGTADNEDIGALEKVEIRIDDGAWETAAGVYEWSYEVNTHDYGNGERSIYARSYNGKNYSDEDRIWVIFNNVEIQISSHEDGKSVWGEEIIIQGTTKGIEVEYIEVSIDGKLDFRAADNSQGGDHPFGYWTFQWNTEGYAEKEYTIKFTPGGENVYPESTTIRLHYKHTPTKNESSSIPGMSVPSIIIMLILIALLRRSKR